MKQVKCSDSDCKAKSFCTHAVPHKERANCFNQEPRTVIFGNWIYRVHCPECRGVKK